MSKIKVMKYKNRKIHTINSDAVLKHSMKMVDKFVNFTHKSIYAEFDVKTRLSYCLLSIIDVCFYHVNVKTSGCFTLFLYSMIILKLCKVNLHVMICDQWSMSIFVLDVNKHNLVFAKNEIERFEMQ